MSVSVLGAGDLVRRDYNGDRPEYVYGVVLHHADCDEGETVRVMWLGYSEKTHSCDVPSDSLQFVARAEHLRLPEIRVLVNTIEAKRELRTQAWRDWHRAKREMQKAAERIDRHTADYNAAAAMLSRMVWWQQESKVSEIYPQAEKGEVFERVMEAFGDEG